MIFFCMLGVILQNIFFDCGHDCEREYANDWSDWEVAYSYSHEHWNFRESPWFT